MTIIEKLLIYNHDLRSSQKRIHTLGMYTECRSTLFSASEIATNPDVITQIPNLNLLGPTLFSNLDYL